MRVKSIISGARFGLITLFVALMVSAVLAQDAAETTPAPTDQPRAATAPNAALSLTDVEIDKGNLKTALEPLTKDELIAVADQWQDLLKAKAHEVSSAAIEGRTVEATDLRLERAAIVERFKIVVDALESQKGEVEPYRLYAGKFSEVELDTNSFSAAWISITGWLKSPQGGVRWAKSLGRFFATLIGFMIVATLISKVSNRALDISDRLSGLMRDFISRTVWRVTMLIGLVVALSALGVDIGPVLAVIGAVGFVVAFALQETLGNFASGLMILLYRPFDVNDVVEVAGVTGRVASLNLVSTTINTLDNKKVVIPNNSIWGGVITNVTGITQRRVDMVFGIGYKEDIALAVSIMEKLVNEHPLALKDPEPVVKLHALADSSVNFVCRPWVKPENYWTVYWDITRGVKEEFDRQGVAIPYPQRDVHVYKEDA